MIFEYLKRMAPYGLVTLCVLLVIRPLRLRKLGRNGRQSTVWHELGVCLFWLSVAGVASQTVVPPLTTLADGSRQLVFGGGTVNLIPFKVFQNVYGWVFEQGHPEYFVIYFLGNIFMFTPIGFFLCLLWQKMRPRVAVLLCGGGSLFIELFQLLLPREIDIDDIWLNTLGGLLGVLFFLLARRWAPGFVTRCRLHTYNREKAENFIE